MHFSMMGEGGARDQSVSGDFVSTLLTLSLVRVGQFNIPFFVLFSRNFSASFFDNFHTLFKDIKRAISVRRSLSFYRAERLVFS